MPSRYKQVDTDYEPKIAEQILTLQIIANWRCTWNIFLVFLNIKTYFQTIFYLCYMISPPFFKRGLLIFLYIMYKPTVKLLSIYSSPLTALPTLEIFLPACISVWWLIIIFSHLITLYKVSENENPSSLLYFRPSSLLRPHIKRSFHPLFC